MPVTLETITLKEFLDIREQLYINCDKIRQNETDRCWNLLSREEFYYTHLEQLIKEGVMDDTNFREQWHSHYIVSRWNHEPYGEKYPSLLAQYNKTAKACDSMEKLNQIYELSGGTRRWGESWIRTKKAIKNNRFLSFWEFHEAYNNTKGSWRHWWDTIDHDDKFKVGDATQFRSHARCAHVYKLITNPKSGYTFIKPIRFSIFNKLRHKVLMVVGYDQQTPDRTYSYKKTQGSHRLVSVLPLGVPTIYYVPEQFLKISRKKTIKDARCKK